MSSIQNRRSFLELSLAGSLALTSNAFAQSETSKWPNRPVRIVVPFNAGGPGDLVARILSVPLGAELGHPVLVENKGGAATILGWDAVAKSAPDGHTMLLAGIGGRTILPAVAKLPYDPEKDIQAVCRIANSPNVFVVRSDYAAKTLQDFIVLARKAPDKLNLGLAAPGTLTHFAGTLLQRHAGIQLTEVAYRGGAPTVNALLAGEIDLMTADLGAVLPYLHAGKLTALAVADAHRATSLPNVPTVQELGLPPIEAVNVWGIYAPAGVSKAIVQRMAATVANVLKKPDVRDGFARLGMVAESSTPAAFEALNRAQTAQWAPIAKSSGVRIN